MRRRSPAELTDFLRITVRAGRGGNGCMSLRREKYLPRGGPDGGDGGTGGDVIVRVNAQRFDLSHIAGRNLFAAGPGTTGGSNELHGHDGPPLNIEVPVGTVVEEALDGAVLGDLMEHAAELLVAKGGKGGRGNARMATPSNRCPRETKPGLVGEERELVLRLKLLVDIALVGPTNAGRSTLLSLLTKANPRIEEWSFTTTKPMLGAVMTEEFDPLVIAELPGLTAGSSEGKGLGNSFLAHAERTTLLAIVVTGGDSGKTEIDMVKNELNLYGVGLVSKPRVICPTISPIPGLRGETQLPAWQAKEHPNDFLKSLVKEWRKAKVAQQLK